MSIYGYVYILELDISIKGDDSIDNFGNVMYVSIQNSIDLIARKQIEIVD